MNADELIDELEYAAVQAVVSGCPLNRLNTAKEALRAAIEELHRDAAKWREYKARKDAVIAAGTVRNNR